MSNKKAPRRITSYAMNDGRIPHMIVNREQFTTHGGKFYAVHTPLGESISAGTLRGDDMLVFGRDYGEIEYVVMSYGTPIAWYSDEYGWHKVTGGSFNSSHLNKLNLI